MMTLTVIPQPLKYDEGTVLMPVWILKLDHYALTKDHMALDFNKRGEEAATFMLAVNAVDGTRCIMPRERSARRR